MTLKKAVKNQSLIRGDLAPSMMALAPFVIFKTGQYIEQKFADLFSIAPLKVRHFACMRLLAHKEADTQQELSEALWIDRATMTGLIKDLLNEKMVKRIFNEEDARSFNLSLTTTGQKFYEKHEPAFIRLEKEMLPSLSAKELETVRSILQKALQDIATL